MTGLGTILASPLLVILAQDHRRGRFVARVSFFTGEGEPIPQELELRDPVFEWESPYLCTPDGLIPLWPGLRYEPRATDGRFGLYLLDGIMPESLRYRSALDSEVITRDDGIREITAWVQLPESIPVSHSGLSHPLLERVDVLDGRTLYGHLSKERSSDEVRPIESEADAREKAVAQEDVKLSTVRDFEQRANGIGLGTAFRDVLYCLVGHGARAELSGQRVRVMTRSEPVRVLAVLQLTTTPSLAVALLRGAMTSAGEEVAETHEVHPGEEADGLVSRIESLLNQEGP